MFELRQIEFLAESEHMHRVTNPKAARRALQLRELEILNRRPPAPSTASPVGRLTRATAQFVARLTSQRTSAGPA